MGSVTRRAFGIAAAGTLTLAALPRRLQGGDREAEGRLAAAPFRAAGADRPVVPEGGGRRSRAAAPTAGRRGRADERRHRVERRHGPQPRRAPDRAGRARPGRRLRLGAHRRDRAGGGAARRAPHRQHRGGAADHRAGLQVRVPELPARARRSAATGWCCWATSSREAKVEPKTAVFMHVNDTFGQSMAKGVAALLPKVSLPFKLLDTIPYDPAAKDLTVEVSKAKATNAELLLLVCRLNDAIVLRREMVKQRWSPMGVVSPGSPGPLRGAVQQGPGEVRGLLHHEHGLVQSQERDHPRVRGGVQEALPEGRVRVSRHQRVLHLRRPPDRRRRVQAREEHGSQGARRGDPADEHPRDRSGHVRRADQVQREGPGRGQPRRW